MNIQDLLKLNRDVSIDMVKYYKDNYKSLHIEKFIVLSFSYQIGFLIDYFEKAHNLHLLVDLNNIIIHYVNAQLNANEIIAKYNSTGIFDDMVYSNYDSPSITIIDNYYKGFTIILSELLQPF